MFSIDAYETTSNDHCHTNETSKLYNLSREKIIPMMEAARTSETSVDNHFTRQYNPEDSSEQKIIK
jgi:hypothetical protein